MSRSPRAPSHVLAAATLLVGLGLVPAVTELVSTGGPHAARDARTTGLLSGHHQRSNGAYWSSDRTRHNAAVQRTQRDAVERELTAALPPEPPGQPHPEPPGQPDAEPPQPEAAPPPPAGTTRQAEVPALDEPPPENAPPPLPVAADPELPQRREPAGQPSDDRSFAVAAEPGPEAPDPTVTDVHLASCRWSPRSDRITGTYTMVIEGGRGFTLVGGVVHETRGPGGPGRATAQTPANTPDPGVVTWDLRLANGSSARDGIPLHVVADVELLAPDGSPLRIPAPQLVIPLAEAGCTEEPVGWG